MEGRNQLETLSDWIQLSLPGIRKEDVAVLRSKNNEWRVENELAPVPEQEAIASYELAYLVGAALRDAEAGALPLTPVFGGLGKRILMGSEDENLTRGQHNLIRSKIGHHLMHLLRDKDIIAFEQPELMRKKGFKEGKWRVIDNKGTLIVTPKKQQSEPYEVVIKDQEWVDGLITLVAEDMETVQSYINPQFEEPEGYTGFSHPVGGDMIRNSNRKLRRMMDNKPNHSVIRALNKQIKTANTVNEDVLSIIQGCKKDKLISLAGTKLTKKQKKSKRNESNNVLAMAEAIDGRKFWSYKFYGPRWRMYGSMVYLKHDGSQLSKSLIQFADKKKVGTDGLFWMKVHAANCWGEDKLPIDDRHDFTEDRMDEWMMCAEENLLAIKTGSKFSNKLWQEADNAFEFLAAICELAKAYRLDDPTEFESGLMIGLDASCSGLQILSALSRDEKSGAMCNLTGRTRGDYYKMIADHVWQDFTYTDDDLIVYNRVVQKLRGITNYSDFNKIIEEAGTDIQIAFKVFYAKLEHMNRKIMKRPCMTFFYCCQPETMAIQLYKDWADEPGFEDLNPVFAYMLAKRAYAACKKLMPGPSALMDLFIELGMNDYYDGEQFSMTAPFTGAPFIQNYHKYETTPIWFKNGEKRMRLRVITSHKEKINHFKVMSATAANVVHLFDSQLVAGLILKADYPISCIHDCFCARPCDAGKLYEDSRIVFTELFKPNLLKELLDEKNVMYQEYDDSIMVIFPERKKKDGPKIIEINTGKLEIEDVLDQEYFVS